MELIGLDFWQVVELKNPYKNLAELCIRAGLSPNSMYNSRSHKRMPSEDSIRKIARAMNIEPDVLINYSGRAVDPSPEFAKDIKDRLNTCTDAELAMIRRLLGLSADAPRS